MFSTNVRFATLADFRVPKLLFSRFQCLRQSRCRVSEHLGLIVSGVKLASGCFALLLAKFYAKMQIDQLKEIDNDVSYA